jgi:hypothetical protein
MGLARPACKDAIHEAVEGASIESHNIPEDFGFGEAEAETPGGLRVVLDRCDAAVAREGDFDGKVKPADTGTKGEPIHAVLCRRRILVARSYV